MRVFNFNGGPAALPLPVLREVQEEFLDWHGTGMSIVENSHRAKEVAAMATEAQNLLLELLGLSSEQWAVAFCQGGASLQFAMVPLNFAPQGTVCDYIDTGLWSSKAFQEAKICGSGARFAASSKDADYTFIPSQYDYSEKPQYVYLTSNNTVRGTQWPSFPTGAPGPLVADVSSEFLSRPLDLTDFGLIFAGAQKNVAPAGLTIAVIRRSFAITGQTGLPHMLDYRTFIDNDSMYNTPPVFAIYVAGLVFKWLKNTVGGLKAMEAKNKAKAALLYSAIDNSGGFYSGTAQVGSRSPMNVTFRLSDSSLEKPFQEEAKKEGLVGLGGHRSVGGLRASLYNALDLDAVEALTGFMAEFKRKKG
ncbi:MAG: 3-phosphoserine/phosphohydroxythreonine transaminase [Deltaproteobacteria bacterium]|jgi:phosphoserine aminotransferase|nr:3-phosphoserine/phosphohydroxythreonine transaminase [Deltaproteobacteria bacterium]